MQQGTARAKSCLEHAQQRQKIYADPGYWDANYEDLMLDTKNVRRRSPGSPKFMPRWMVPVRFEKKLAKLLTV